MNRRFEITKSLLNNPDFQTIESIARSFNVSARTIRSDVEYIEKLLWEYGFDMVKSRKLGIRINADDISMDIKKKILFSISGDVYQEEKSRIDAIINYLLLKDSRFTLNSIIDNFMVSKNTAIKDLKKCEEILKGQHIYLESNKKRGTHLLYSEYHYRQAMLNSICKLLGHADFQKLYQSFDDMSFLAFDMYANDAIDRFTRSINLVLIKNFIKKYESDLGIKFSDESFVRVFLYLCIAITRIREGRLLKSVDYTELYTDTENVEWIQKNHKLLEAGMQISFDENECLGIIMVLMSCNKYYLHLEEDVDEGDLEILVKRYVGAVENDFKIDLAEDEGLINNLIMHMRPAIYRAKYNIKIDNPLTEEIMEKYTDIFEVCKKSCKIFEEPWNVSFDDGEIAYLVMHIASSIESNKKTKGFFHNVLVVCHSGIGASNMVVSRLLTEFPNIIIKGEIGRAHV